MITSHSTRARRVWRGRLPQPHSTVSVQVSRGVSSTHVHYSGAAEALIAAGIITASLLGKPRDIPTLDERGMPVRVSRAPTKRMPERLKVARWTEGIESHAFIMSLPGIGELLPGGLPEPEQALEATASEPSRSSDLRCCGPARLRLVVDNTSITRPIRSAGDDRYMSVRALYEEHAQKSRAVVRELLTEGRYAQAEHAALTFWQASQIARAPVPYALVMQFEQENGA